MSGLLSVKFRIHGLVTSSPLQLSSAALQSEPIATIDSAIESDEILNDVGKFVEAIHHDTNASAISH